MDAEVRQSGREARWLIVDDDPGCRRALHRLIGFDQPVTVAGSEQEARAALVGWDRWSGFLIDQRLGDGTGLAVLSFARQRHPHVPAAMVTGDPDPAVINRTFSLGAGFLCKPVAAPELMGFISRCLAASRSLVPALASLVEALARAHALSRREVELLVCVVSGESRADIQRTMTISENTLKSHTRSLLRKLDACDLNDVIIQVLRAALDC
jgi:DNA-binding NarL/FixJ family response regulator